MSATQPFLIAEGPWVEIRDGDLSAVALYRRHYSYRPRRSGRKINLIVGPGYKLVLLTPDATGDASPIGALLTVAAKIPDEPPLEALSRWVNGEFPSRVLQQQVIKEMGALA